MKRMWMILSTLAIANILAIGALVGWLHSSGRLNKERVLAVRTMLSTTWEQEQQQKAEAAAHAQMELKQAEDAARQAIPPETAAERIGQMQLDAEKQLQNVLRQKQELASLRAGLMKQLEDLEQREKQLASQRAAFDAERKRIAETEGTQQFKVALTTLENQKAKDAKAVLKALLGAREVDQVVAYLSKMDESKRSKIIAEFVKDEPAVAADLLERLRTYGLTPRAPANTPGVPMAAGGPATDDPNALRNP